MNRLFLALAACAGLAFAVPATAASALPGTSVTASHAPDGAQVLDVRYHHHRRHHHYPHA